MMHGKSGNTVNRGPVNRELTVSGVPDNILYMVLSEDLTARVATCFSLPWTAL